MTQEKEFKGIDLEMVEKNVEDTRQSILLMGKLSSFELDMLAEQYY